MMEVVEQGRRHVTDDEEDEEEEEDNETEALERLWAHVAEQEAHDNAVSNLQDASIKRHEQTILLEKEAFVSSIPFSINATELVEYIESRLFGSLGDNVVRVQFNTKDGVFKGQAFVLFRDEARFQTFKSMGSHTILRRELRVTEGSGASKLRRKFSYEAKAYDISRFEIGLPYDHRTDQPFVLCAQFCDEAASTLHIDAKRAAVSVVFRVGGDEYRADFFFRRLRSCRLEFDEHSNVVLTFRSEEPAKLYRKPEDDEEQSPESASSQFFIRSSNHFWELSTASTVGSNWSRTTDPLWEQAPPVGEIQKEVFKNSLMNRVFLKIGRDDEETLGALTSLLQSYNLVAPSFINRLSPVRASEARTECHSAGGLAYYCDYSEVDIFLRMKEMGLPFEVAYWLHALIGANKIDLVQETPSAVRELVELLLLRYKHSPSFLFSNLRSLFLDRTKPFVHDLRPLIDMKAAPHLVVKRAATAPASGNFVLIRQVNVTPLRICPQPESFEPLNRVLRTFSQFRDRFLRVRFVDENFSSVLSCARSHDILEGRIRPLALNGIWVGGYHFNLLAFSNASLREQSCWFYDEHPRPGCSQPPSAQTVRDSVGDLSHITVIGKYAARLGQGFSSTQSVATHTSSQFVVIKDVKRPLLLRRRGNHRGVVRKRNRREAQA